MRRINYGGGASRTKMEVIKLRKTWMNYASGGGNRLIKMHLVSSFVDKGQHIATYRFWTNRYGWIYETKPAYIFSMTWQMMEKLNG